MTLDNLLAFIAGLFIAETLIGFTAFVIWIVKKAFKE